MGQHRIISPIVSYSAFRRTHGREKWSELGCLVRDLAGWFAVDRIFTVARAHGILGTTRDSDP